MPEAVVPSATHRCPRRNDQCCGPTRLQRGACSCPGRGWPRSGSVRRCERPTRLFHHRDGRRSEICPGWTATTVARAAAAHTRSISCRSLWHNGPMPGVPTASAVPRRARWRRDGLFRIQVTQPRGHTAVASRQCECLLDVAIGLRLMARARHSAIVRAGTRPRAQPFRRWRRTTIGIDPQAERTRCP